MGVVTQLRCMTPRQCVWRSKDDAPLVCVRCGETCPAPDDPTAETWRACSGRDMGLGDTVDTILRATGIKAWWCSRLKEPEKGCRGCKERQSKLNRAVPYGK